jgi:hypothetical protein
MGLLLTGTCHFACSAGRHPALLSSVFRRDIFDLGLETMASSLQKLRLHILGQQRWARRAHAMGYAGQKTFGSSPPILVIGSSTRPRP